LWSSSGFLHCVAVKFADVSKEHTAIHLQGDNHVQVVADLILLFGEEIQKITCSTTAVTN
jgi:hypothetical protein